MSHPHEQESRAAMSNHGDDLETAGGTTSACREALDTLYSYLDGELTEQRRHDITSHLDRCSSCLEAFDFEAELKVVVARRCREQVPEHLRLRVARALADASATFHLPG